MDALVEEITRSGFQELPVKAKHAERTAALSNIYRDPFDRMLIAQAPCEPWRLLTVDAKLRRYSDLIEVI